MKKFLLVLAGLFIFLNYLSAKRIDTITAGKAAQNYILHYTGTFLKTAEMKLVYTEITRDDVILSKTGTQSEPVFYIFNINQTQGFVIVAGDDAVTPVLGYSTASSYTGQNMPPAFVKLLEKYKQEIIFIKQNNLSPDNSISRSWYQLSSGKIMETRGTTSVAPLVITKWDQLPYYNDMCPYDYTYHDRTVTGCAATAMAQIMKFWNYPATGTGFHSYNHNTYGTLSANFGNTTYQWTSMPTQVTGTNSAVATLMYHCGVSVEMNYGVASQGGSGAYIISSASPVTACVEYALKTYFSYDPATLQGLERKNYTNSAWIALLKADLDAGRPIQYAGFGQGGHTFVCDGYDNSNNFHFNWGWSGMYDGYFDIDNLNPGSGGTGGGAGTYNNGQQALLGIKPISGGTPVSDLQIYSAITVTPNPINYASSFTVNVDIFNNGTTTYSDSFATAIFNSSGVFVDFIKILSSGSIGLPSGYHYTGGMTFSNTGLTSATPGTYIIAVYYKSGNNWKIIPPGSYTNYIVVDIVGPANDISIYDSIVPSPRTITRTMPVSIPVKIANYSSTTGFYGDFSIDIHKIDGTWIKTIDYRTGRTITTMHYDTFNFKTTGLDVPPGTYLLVVWDKPNGGSWEITGSGLYSNPVTVTVIEPTLPPDPYEKNNTLDSAYLFNPTYVSNAATIKTTGSNIHVGNDYDFYKFILPSGYTYTITARVHDKYNSGDGNTYTANVLFAYKKGSSWSNSYDDVMPGPFNMNGGDTLAIYVAPYFLGNIGTYLLQVNITRATAPFISITAPATGTDWKAGSSQNIFWNDNISENVIIELFKGTSQLMTLSSSTPSNGTFPWTVPGTLTPANDYRIKITSVTDNSVYAYSSMFNISAASSVNDLTQSPTLNIYPNPASGYINLISGNKSEFSADIKIINSIGDVVLLQNNVKIMNGTCRIELTNLSDGLYYVVINTIGSRIVKSFLKEGY